MRPTFPQALTRYARPLAATALVLALAVTYVAAQFGSFDSAFEGELWGVRSEVTLADEAEAGGVAYVNGMLFVSDRTNEMVVAYDSGGAVVSFANAEWVGFVPGELTGATVSVGGQDTQALLVSDAGAHRVLAFDLDGQHLFTMQLERPGIDRFNVNYAGAPGGIFGMAMGPGARFVLTTTGTPALALENSFAAAWSNQYESDGAVLAYRNLSTTMISFNGTDFLLEPTAVLDGVVDGNLLTRPGQVLFGLQFDPQGNLYTIDTNTERLNVYSDSFAHRFTFGTPAVDGTLEEFEQPYGMVYSPVDGGRLYIGDSDHFRVEIYKPNLANNTLDYVSTIAAFGADGLPRSLALDATTGKLAVSNNWSGNVWILDRPGLAAFDLQVLDAVGTPVEDVCAGDPYQVRFSLTVPAGRAPVGGIVPELAIDDLPVGATPTPLPAGVELTAGQVVTYTYELVMPSTVPSTPYRLTAGATASTTDVLAREALLQGVNCVGAAPTIQAFPSIPPQVSGWTPVRPGETFELRFEASDAEGVAAIEYQITGSNNLGTILDPVPNPGEGTTQTLVLPLPEYGFSTITYRVYDTDNRKSPWQTFNLRSALVRDKVSVEGDTVTLAVGLPVGTGFVFSATGLPPGMSIDPQTGQIGGILGFDAAGEYTTIVTETLGSATSFVSFEWTVVNWNRPPIVEPLAAPFVVDEGSYFELQFVGYDPDGDPAVFTAFGRSVSNPQMVLPQTVSIHPVTGLLSGYFPFGSDTEYEIFVGLGECSTLEPAPPCYEVLPGERLATLYEFVMTVTPVNQPPFAFPPANQQNVEGDVISGLQINGSDPDGDPLTYQAANLPPGLTIDANTGLITGTIAYDAVRTPYVVIVEIDDHITDSYSITFTWTVANTNRPPTASIDNRTDPENATVSFGITSDDPDDDTLTYSATGLPAGISINPGTGVISGTLGYTTANTYNVVVTVTDSGGLFAEAPFTWTVTNVNAPPVVTNPGNQNHLEGATVSVQITASDVDAQTLTYSASGLPPGLTIDATGLITGSLSYTTAGTYPAATVTVFDGVTSRSVTFTWTVTNVNRAPVVVNPGTQTNPEGASITLPISASDPDGDTLTYSATGLPPGLSMNAAGVITGTIAYSAAPGPYGVTVRASDGTDFDEQSFVWSVTDTNQAPTATPDSASVIQGQSVVIAVLANDTDPDGNGTLSIQSVGTPSQGSVVINSNGTLTYAADPTYIGPAYFSYTITDGTATSTAQVTVNVQPNNRPPVCSAAFTTADLWPPNHRQVYVTISGITDPDGGTPTIRFTSILQDEPTNSPGQGNTMQDGGIENNGARAWVRAERSGTRKVPGDGRVYLIEFTATDASGASCTGTVRVDVPHDQRGTPAVLSPGRWNSITGQQVSGAPPAPVANDDTLAASAGSPATLQVLSNDVSNGQSLAVSIVSEPKKGQATVNSNGVVIYTPPNNWAGTTTFTYQVVTPTGAADTAVVTVTVTRQSNDDDCGDREHDHSRDKDNRDRDHKRGDHDRCNHGDRDDDKGRDKDRDKGRDKDRDKDDDCGDREHDHSRDKDNRDRDHKRGDHDRCNHGRR